MGAPEARGGASNHRADVTMYWQEDVEVMAQATYADLKRYPEINHRVRRPADWSAISATLPDFSRAGTKAAKARWFTANGITDVSFLDGISLPDGPGWKTVAWRGRKLPILPGGVSKQFGIQGDLLDFFNAFFVAWLTTPNEGRAWVKFLGSPNGRVGDRSWAISDGQHSDLALTLSLWRLRDHGAAIGFLGTDSHAKPSDRRSAEVLVGRAGAIVRYESVVDAVLPMLIESSAPSPLLPFVIVPLKEGQKGKARAIALVKLLDAPYDTVGLVAEHTEVGWRIVGLTSSADY
jgi:hypothetical protein